MYAFVRPRPRTRESTPFEYIRHSQKYAVAITKIIAMYEVLCAALHKYWSEWTTNKYKITIELFVCLLKVRHAHCVCEHPFASCCCFILHENTFNPSNLDISNVMKIDYLLNYCWVSMLRRCCSRCPARSRARGESRDSHERD